MRDRLGVSRRAFLRAGLIGGVTACAGCVGGGDTQESTPTTSPPEDSPFEDIDFEGEYLVVHLREDHALTGLNLIAPDGSLFTQTRIATGATTARLQILDIKPGLNGFEHYTIGRHELVGVREKGSISVSLELTPELQIVGVQQFLEGDQATDLGKLAVTVENVGNSPTWIYDITYRDAPNTTANNELTNDPGIPQITKPKNPEDLVLNPGERRSYVGTTVPFLFADRELAECRGETEISVLVGITAGESLEKQIVVASGGDVQSAGLLDEYVCTDLSIEMVAGGSNG